MTRQDFLKFAIENNPINKTERVVGFDPYDRYDLEAKIRKEYSYRFNTEKILDFFENIGCVNFDRVESVSGDILTVDIRWQVYIYRWEDIGEVVNCIGYIENCAGRIEELYMSESGRFYGKDHILHANNEENFFDFLLTVEYDFHPVIGERVLDVLRKAGWYEGRRVDVSLFDREMKRRGIRFSQAQLDFLSEFSGLHFSCGSEYCYIPSVIELLNDCEFALDEQGNHSIIVSDNFGLPYYLDYNGLISLSDRPIGRTAMECVNHIVKSIYCWREPDEKNVKKSP